MHGIKGWMLFFIHVDLLVIATTLVAIYFKL